MSAEDATLKPPKGCDSLLELLAREVLREQPSDIKSFAAQLFTNRLAARSEQAETGSTIQISGPVTVNLAEVAGEDDSTSMSSASEEPSTHNFDLMQAPTARRGRRVSVSAESMNPDMLQNVERVVHHKTEEQKERIMSMVKNNFLFHNLDDEQLDEVVLSMFEKTASVGEAVVTQGDDGDYFYVVESGTFDIFVTPYGEEPANVGNIGTGGSFGELALMYNAPRAATVECTSDAVLWAMDRMTFRRILMDTTSKKRKMYESFLSSIEILSCIEPYERVKIADGLDSLHAGDGEDIIKQGEVGDKFYLVEKGNLVVIVDDMEVSKLKKGDYFGELALLFSQPRKATVRTVGDVTVAYLGVEAFNRMLGPCSDIMRRGISHYDDMVAEAKNRSQT